MNGSLSIGIAKFVAVSWLWCLSFPATTLAIPASGIDLSWNDCVGGAPVASRNFDCGGAEDQSYDLIFQFKVNQPIPNFKAITALVGFTDDTGVLSPFWHFEAGGCQRSGGPSPDGLTLAASIPASCVAAGFGDPWDVDFSGAGAFIVSYVEGNPGRATMQLNVVRVTGTYALEAGLNYYAFHLSFNTRNRSTCAGCSDPVGLCWLEATLYDDGGAPVARLASPDKFGLGVMINGGFAVECMGDAVLDRTWGRLKSMYR